MTVFKGYMKIIGQNRMLILLYVAIFFGCTLLFQSTAGKSETSYQAEKLNIGIVDEDGGSLAESLTEYLGNLHHLIPVENDVSEIQEKLYYREVYYVVRIPENFMRNVSRETKNFCDKNSGYIFGQLCGSADQQLSE